MPQKEKDLSPVLNAETLKIDYSSVKEFRELDLEETANRKLRTFTQYRRVRPLRDKPIRRPVARPSMKPDMVYLEKYSPKHYPKGRMLVIVNDDLYPFVKESITQYVRDLAYAGHYAVTYRYKGGTATQLRDFIRRFRVKDQERTIRGAVLVGTLPVAWFEHQEKNGRTENFPCDLFFMDLNGKWKDPDKDGDFNTHADNVYPEIWVGRIWTPTMGGNDPNLVNDYFERNHAFRTGYLGCTNKALALVDDDWAGFGDCALDEALPSSHVTVHTNKEKTTVHTYKYEMTKSWAWAQVCAHSNALLHAFRLPKKITGEALRDLVIPVSYIRDQNPSQAFFYNLYASSNARYTQADYMGGWYIFDKEGFGINPGMAAIGSTCTGAMLYFENFYRPMAVGSSIGEALLQWWSQIGIHNDFVVARFYGLTLLGDPTLNWWHGAVPRMLKPLPEQEFSHYPRETRFEWEPVQIEGMEVEYHVEIDAEWAAKGAGKWAPEDNQEWLKYKGIKTNYIDHIFVGAQRGRWRVRAKVGDMLCPWSEWSYFRYTV
ncbi:MAG: C25 family cysteine peptidase [Porphyromonadaceae bacterium]|nr:C25 family cysteine peptidase [Porphyromonadaceae bacterium]